MDQPEKEKKPTGTRCFLAFEFSPESREYLELELRPFAKHLTRDLKWDLRKVRPENWHVTLLFFEGLDSEQRAEVWQAAESLAKEGIWKNLAFEWQKFSVWPNPRRPSLICLEAALYPGAVEWPLPLTQSPYALGRVNHLQQYRPHATLMRFHRRWRRSVGSEWEALKPDLPKIKPEKIKLDRLSLFLSTLSRDKPLYPREFTVSLEAG